MGAQAAHAQTLARVRIADPPLPMMRMALSERLSATHERLRRLVDGQSDPAALAEARIVALVLIEDIGRARSTVRLPMSEAHDAIRLVRELRRLLESTLESNAVFISPERPRLRPADLAPGF
jgi:hypothetical protein